MCPFSFALGMKVGLVTQGEMDDAALAGRHRAELVRSSRFADLFGSDSGCRAQFLNAHGTAILTIEADLLVLARGQAQHFQREKLECAKKLSTTVEQKRGVRAGEVDEDLGLLPVAIFR